MAIIRELGQYWFPVRASDKSVSLGHFNKPEAHHLQLWPPHVLPLALSSKPSQAEKATGKT